MILFDANKCVSCNSCIRACPTPEANKAVQTEDGRTVYNIDPDKCIRCGACVKDCSHGARTYEDDTAGFWGVTNMGRFCNDQTPANLSKNYGKEIESLRGDLVKFLDKTFKYTK